MDPTWQRTPCPPWCSGGHVEHDHADDRVHRSEGEGVEVVSRRLVGSAPVAHSVRTRDYQVGLSRRDGDDRVWVYLGAGPDEYLEVALDSCRELLETLRRVADRADGDAEAAAGGPDC